MLHHGCIHKLDPDNPGYDPAVRKLLEIINLPDFGSVFTNAWLSTELLTKGS